LYLVYRYIFDAYLVSVSVIQRSICISYLFTRAADQLQLTQRLTWNTLIAINFFNRD